MGKEMLINKIETVENDLRYQAQKMVELLKKRRFINAEISGVKEIIHPLKSERKFLKRDTRETALLISLQGEPCPCGMSFKNKGQVDYCIDSPICTGETCFYYPVCAEISQQGNKKPAPKKMKGQRATIIVVKKAGKSRGENIPILKDFSIQGTFTFRFNQAVYTVSGYTNFKEYKKALKAVLPMKSAISIGMTAGQWQGLTHYGSMGKKLNVPKG